MTSCTRCANSSPQFRADNPNQIGFAYLRSGYMASDPNASASDRKKSRKLFSEFNKERQNTLADMLGEEKTYSRLLTEVRDTIQARSLYMVLRLPEVENRGRTMVNA